MNKKIILVGVLLIITFCLFAAGQSEETVEAPELIVQLMADAPADAEMVTEAINEILLDKIGVTVKFQNLTWADWQQKYKLILVSGEKVDVLYSATWLQYANYAQDGAFIELDKLLPVAAPKLWEEIPQSDWDGVKVDGKIYAMPDLQQTFSGSYHMLYREDLRKKYNTPPIIDIETMEQYFDAIKAAEPQMYPCNAGKQDWLQNLLPFMIAKSAPESAWEDFYQIPGPTMLFLLDYKNPRTSIKAIWDFPEYRLFLETVRRWAEKGFWSEDILSEKNLSQDLMEAGKSAAGISLGFNLGKVQKYIERISTNSPEWESKVFSFSKERGFTIPSKTTQDITVVPIQSRYPEKALQVVESFLFDNELQDLINYGIKGKHYDLTDEEAYKQLPGSSGYGLFGMNAWGWVNSDMLLKQSGGWGDQFKVYNDIYESIAVPNFGFELNSDNIVAELIAVQQVFEQYGLPLFSGLVDDIDAGQALFEKKMQEAGIEKVRAELQRQLFVYLDEIGK
jgi:putative aldouronate transport system substrate-binding protein